VEVAAIKSGDARRMRHWRCDPIGFDLNAGMLARARASRETAAAIEWRLGNATDVPLLMRLSTVSFANTACNSFLTKPQRFLKV
jgi:hypothetical protein